MREDITMREQIIALLENINPGIDYENQTRMIDDHVLESMELLQLVSDLSDEFDIEITVMHIKPEHFQSVETICKLVEQIMGED